MPEAPQRGSVGPLYSVRAIAVGTILGSLAAGAVMLWLNYRNLGYPALANRVAALGGLLYLIIIGVASLLPNNPLLGVIFIALQTGLAYWTATALQSRAIAYHQQQGGPMYSTARGALVGFLAGISVIFAMLLIGSVLAGLTAGI
jgi:amino acid transporter